MADTTTLAALAAALLLVAVAIAYWIISNSSSSSSGSGSSAATARRRGGGKRDSLLLAGLCGSGKTALFFRLTRRQFLATCTSMQENVGQAVLDETDAKRSTVRVMDLPGHEKLRFKHDAAMASAKGILFVVDATACQPSLSAAALRRPAQHGGPSASASASASGIGSGVASGDTPLRAAAEYLYDLLAHRDAMAVDVPVAVLCNKSDDELAASPKRIQELLEHEIDELRKTRGASIAGQGGVTSSGALANDDDGDDSGRAFLGFEGEAFRFEHIPNDVVFVAVSCKDNTAGAPSGSSNGAASGRQTHLRCRPI
ncbi:signal recognition particle receptor beta subunit-domain-containing protein [Entophlyctis helioformis]|nr:signal recognition particle receptor beta subunit-domain-containing protein [Entophlyctis helioformis]